MEHSFARYVSIVSYILIFLLNGFLFYFFGSYAFLMILSAMLILPIGSFFVCYILSKFIQVNITGASYVENRSDEFVFHLTVTNPTLFFANNCTLVVSISNSLFKTEQTHILNVPVNPLLASEVHYPCTSEHCGVLSIRVNKLCIYDMFHFFCITKKANCIKEIPVFPNYSVITEDFSMDFAEGYNNLDESPKKGTDSSEVHDIREYIPGDRLQDIHWKLSAKSDQLMVKEHISLTSSQLVLYLELSNDDSMLDDIMDYAYGIGNYLCMHNIPFTLLWYSMRKQDCCKSFIFSAEKLKETIMEILFESPLDDCERISQTIAAMSGFHHYITIGVDYVSKKKEESIK